MALAISRFIQDLPPKPAGSICAGRSTPRPRPRSRRRWIAMACWCSAISRSTRTNSSRFTRWFGPLDIGLKKVFRAPNRFKHEESIDISRMSGSTTNSARQQAVLQHRQPAVAQRQLVPGDAGEILAAERPGGAAARRRDRIRRHARGLRRAARRHEAADRRAGRRALGAAFAHPAQRYRPHRGRRCTCRPSSGGRAPPSRIGRKTLFIGVHCREILGMTLPEGRVLLLDLSARPTRSSIAMSGVPATW